MEPTQFSYNRQLHQVTGALARFSYLHFRVLLALAAILVLVSPLYLIGFRVDSDFSRVFPSGDPLIQAYNENRKVFGEPSPLVLYLTFEEQHRRFINPFTKRLVTEIQDIQNVEFVDYLRLDMRDVQRSASMLRAALFNSGDSTLEEFLDRLEPEGMERQLRRTRKKLLVLDDPELRQAVVDDVLGLRELMLRYFKNRTIDSTASGSNFFDSPDGLARVVLIQPTAAVEDPFVGQELLNKLETTISQIKASLPETAGITARFTGVHAFNAEAGRDLRQEMLLITLVAGLLVLFLVWLTFRSLIVAFLCFSPLLVSICVNLLIARVFFNPINYFTIGFAAIILGLGLDVGLHLTARFLRFSRSQRGIGLVVSTLEDCGPPVVIGILSTAAAFSALVFSQNQGLKELGLLTATGLIACLFINLALFPSLARLIAPSMENPSADWQIRWVPRSLLSWPNRSPWIAAGVAMIIVVFGTYKALSFSPDMNFDHVFPQNLKSLDTAHELSEAFGTSFPAAVEITVDSKDYAQAFEFQKTIDLRLEKMVTSGLVSSFDSPSNYLPYSADLAKFGLPRIQRAVQEARRTLDELLAKLRFKRDESITSYYSMMLASVQNESPFNGSGENHPEMTRVFIRDGSKYRLRTLVWPVVPSDSLIQFGEAESLHISDSLATIPVPSEVRVNVTGLMQLHKRLDQLTLADFTRLGWTALILVFILVLLFFRRLTPSILTFVPIAAAIPTVLGVLVECRIDFSPTAFTFAAVIFGVGVDDAVHVLARADTGNPRFAQVFDEIGPVICLTTFSTMFGFGALMLSAHPIVHSVGFVIALGVLACWFFTLFSLPAAGKLMEAFSRNR